MAIALDSDVITNETVSQVIGAVFTLLCLDRKIAAEFPKGVGLVGF